MLLSSNIFSLLFDSWKLYFCELFCSIYTDVINIIINSARLLLKSFRELPCQFESVSRTQEEWLLLVISVIYLLSAKPRKLLWGYSILNAHCKHMIFLIEKKVFQGSKSVPSDSFHKWNFQFIDNWFLFIAYLKFLPT